MSPIYGPRTDIDWANTDLVTLTGGAMYSNDRLILDPKDRTPNRNWRDIGPDGAPLSWGIDLPLGREGSNPYLSRPGNFDEGTAEEQDPPRQDTLTKQTTHPLAIGKSWATHKALIFGWQPEHHKRRLSRLAAPQAAPEVTVLGSVKNGFAIDTYGIRVDFRVKRGGKRTLPSGYTFVTTTATGQGFRVYIPPEAIGSGANFMGVYVTRPGTGGLLGTEREQEVGNLKRLAATGYVDVDGPYHDNGKRPASQDESGIGSPPPPLFRRRRGRAFVHKGHARFNLLAGIYRFGYIVREGEGFSIVSDLTRQETVEGDVKQKEVKRELQQGEQPDNDETLKVINGVRYGVKTTEHTLSYQENRAFYFHFPGLPKGWRVIPVVYYQPPGTGDGVWYRVVHATAKSPEEMAYGQDFMDKGVPIYGYPEGMHSGTLDNVLVSMGAPGKEDTTGIPGPDPASGPDVIAQGIALIDAPADYFAATTDEDTLGNETKLSPRTDVSLTTLGQGVRIFPSQPVNQLRNAEGSERAADDTVFNWTNLGTTNGVTAKFEDGSLHYYGTASGTPIAPMTDLMRIPTEGILDVAIKGQLRLYSVTNTTSATRLILRYFDDNATNSHATTGQISTDVTLLEAKATGKINLGELGQLFGPNGTAFPEGATQFKLIATGQNSSWNSRGYFENLGVFYYPVGVRKFERKALDEPVTFNPTAQTSGTVAGAAVPYPSGSTFGVGPAQAAEEDPPAAEPLIEEVTFEGGSWPAGWSTTPFSGSNNGSDSVGTTGAIFGTNSVTHTDTTENNVKQHLRRRTFSNADLATWGGSALTSLYVRVYDRADQRPTKGEALRFRIVDDSGTPKVMASIYYTKTAVRMYRHDTSGTRVTSSYVTVLSGLGDDQDTDIELGVTDTNSKNGVITVTAGANGNPRTFAGKYTGRDFSGRKARSIDFGYRESDAGANLSLIADNILVSASGAPTNYEALSSPGGVTVPATPPGPDAPPKSGGGYRLYDANNDVLNQLCWFAEPGVTRVEGQDYGPYCKDIISVFPGEVITHAIAGGYTMFETPEEPSHQFFVTLYGPDMAPLEVGSPFAAGKDATTVSRSGGARMNNAVTAGMSSSATINNEDDFYQAFTIPEGYLWALIGPKNGVGGSYVFQEHLFHPGTSALTTQAARDAERDYGRATSGSAEIIIPAFTEENPYRWSLNADRMDMGVVAAGLATASTITNVMYSSSNARLGTYTTPTSEPTEVPENNYYKIAFDMNGESGMDGESPVISPGGVFVQLRPFVSVLLKEDRSEFPGGIFLNGLDSPTMRARSEILSIDGDVVDARRTKEVSYLKKPITGYIATEEAKRLLESMYADDELEIEAPFLMAEGRSLRIRPGVEIVVDTSIETAFISDGKRNVYGAFQIPANAAQVIEEAPLLSP